LRFFPFLCCIGNKALYKLRPLSQLQVPLVSARGKRLARHRATAIHPNIRLAVYDSRSRVVLSA
jgi:hypothetical protein